MLADEQDESNGSSGMTLRKSTRILRKSVPALPVKAASVKKSSAHEPPQSKPSPEAKAAVKEEAKEWEPDGSREAEISEMQRGAGSKAGGK